MVPGVTRRLGRRAHRGLPQRAWQLRRDREPRAGHRRRAAVREQLRAALVRLRAQRAVTSPAEHVRRDGPVVVIVMSHKTPAQVHRLVDRLQVDGDGDVVTVVHHDPAGEPLDLPNRDGVIVMPDPQRCRWGQYDKVVGIWRCLLFAAREVPEHSWILLVSGQDYPAMPVRSIVDELQTSPYDAYMRLLRLDGNPADDVHHWQALARRRYLHRRRAPFYHRSIPWLPRHPFRGHPGLHTYGGDDWFNLSSTAVRLAIESSDLAERLLRFCRTAPN